MQIKMFSDTICGWCYIGKERLNQAIEQLNLSQSIVMNLPFQLNPSMPKDGMDRIDYIKSKFGSIENAKPMYDNMIMQGEQENLQIKLDKIQRTPNTVKSHLLVDFARKYKVENNVITDLFENYFVKAKDIGDQEVLVSIAKKNKLPVDKVKESAKGEDKDVINSAVADLEQTSQALSQVLYQASQADAGSDESSEDVKDDDAIDAEFEVKSDEEADTE